MIGPASTQTFETMTVAQLKDACRDRGIGSGVWRQGAKREALLAALESGHAGEVTPPAPGSGDLARILAAAVEQHLTGRAIDADAVRAIVDERLVCATSDMAVSVQGTIANAVTEALKSHTREIVVKTPAGDAKNVGVQHYAFPTLLKMVSANVPVWLVGPAGSGKTHAAEAIAEALNLEPYTQSVCGQTPASFLVGYMNATGQYVRTMFRDAYENGGVYLLDEVDAGNPNVLTAPNAAASNGHCSFPDGMIPRHADFRLIAAANTHGTGADRQYVGRNPIDAATIDRYAFLTWDYDADLERHLATGSRRTTRQAPTPRKARDVTPDAWVDYVQAARQTTTRLGIRATITPRASIYGVKLLEGGLHWDEVAAACLWRGMAQDSVAKIKAEIGQGAA